MLGILQVLVDSVILPQSAPPRLGFWEVFMNFVVGECKIQRLDTACY